MNVIVLLAGDSQQFYDFGYKYPKPLIEINGSMMINRVLDQLYPLFDHGDKIIILIQREDNRKFHLSNIIKLLVPDAITVEINGATGGAACTALLSVDHIDHNSPLLIINGDQIIDLDYLTLLDSIVKKDCDAGTVVFNSVHPRWSYVKLDSKGNVVEAAEKKPISKNATAGIYYFKHASYFINSAERMILKDASTNDMFYVCPVFNEMVLDQKKIAITRIDLAQYHSLMSPELVSSYQKHLERIGDEK